MKLRILVIAGLLAAFLQGVAFAQMESAETWNKRGVQYYNQGDYAKAIESFLKAKDIIEKTKGKEHADYATSLYNTGMLYARMGNYAKAESFYLEAKAIYEKIYGKEHPTYASTVSNLGSLYSTLGNYTRAEIFHLEARAIREKILGKEHPDYVVTINNLGALYYRMENYVKAESYMLEAKAITEKTQGKESSSYITSLNNLGSLYNGMGDYKKAENFYLEARALNEKLLGKQHPDYAISLNNLGGLYDDMGDYAKAEIFYLEAKAIREKTLGKEHPDYARSLNNLGVLYLNTGNYTKAESCYLEALVIREKVLGKAHPDYATSLNNLGLLYKNMGDYGKAENFYLQAKAIREKRGKENLDYAGTLNNMGALYDDMGDYAQAEKYFLDSSAIYEKVLGKEHPNYARSLNNLGSLYKDTGNYTKAEKYYLDARDIWGKTLGKEHPEYARALSNLGGLYDSMGNYTKAESIYLENKAVCEKALGKEHPDYAVSLNNLGSVYKNMGDYAKAEQYYLEAKAIIEKKLGKDHSYYIASLGNLCTLYMIKKEYPKALTCKQEQIKINTDNVNKNFSFQTEQQRDAYWNVNSSSFELSFSLSLYHNVPASNILNYDNALFSKGLLLRTTNAVRDSVYASGNKELIAQFEELGRLRQQISALRQSSGDEAYIKSLETRADTLDKSLAAASAAFKEFQSDLAVNWTNIQKGLQKGEAAVEFVSFKVYDKKWTDTIQYAALVLKPDSKAPVWVPLCTEESLLSILNRANGRNSEQQARIIYNANGTDLFDMVWKSLEKELKGVTTVYYSPAGLLHKIAFNALPTDNSFEVRLTDKYKLNLVSSTREVVHLDRKPAAAQIASAVLYGGLDYNADEIALRTAAQSFKVASVQPERATRGSVGGTAPMALLENSLPEVKNIQDFLNRKKITNTLYQDSLGNEESFKQLNGKKTGLIHMATHGFFQSDVKRKHDDSEQTQEQSASVLKAEENPLLRSWLLMAGGNHTLANNPLEGMENGILTAAEIAGLNLIGTKLVVMSACQTGLGDVNNSEGVFGLQRAFKLAGVETLVMSLWEVDDEATAILMSTFYNEWLISGKSKQDAFKAAQKKVREEYPMPFFWAAFVMMD